MNIFAGLGFVAVAGAAVYFFASPRPADEFAMPVSTAYAKLSTAKLVPSSRDGVYYALDTKVFGNGTDKVTWEASGSMAYHKCSMALAPAGGKADQTHVTVTCEGGGAGDGAAAGMVHNMIRARVLEMVDATLTDRAFDSTRVGATASRWPGDGVDGSLMHAQSEALKMSAEMGKMQRESAKHANDPLVGDEGKSSSY